MKKSLYIKFVTSFFLLGFVALMAVTLFGSDLVRKYLIDLYSGDLYKEATAIAESGTSREYMENVTVANIDINLKTLATYQGAVIWIITPEGRVLIDTSLDTLPVKPAQIRDFNPGHSSGSYYQIGDFFGQFQEEQLSVLVPITLNMNIKGYVAIHYPMSGIEEQQVHFMNIVYILMIVILSIMFLILGVFSFLVYRPLRKIIAGADAFAAGDLKHNIPVQSQDEIGYLALTLNYMSDELDKTGEYQRKFISNVSHDFRSPLTSIKGYSEAILDGTIPPEMQDKYLNIVVFETDRLYKLTQSLLTLNDMDEKGRMLDITNFDINNVIKTTAATFEGTCRSKHISIELVLTDQNLYVSADMGKIQQVLYNLIDNATKFSPADSSIRIETTIKHDTVFISVKDSGCGIPRESIPKIWDRFYKIDVSRGKDRKGTGLGLAIVKDIIQAHNQHINVISTEGAGTEFIFTLPRKTDSDPVSK